MIEESLERIAVALEKIAAKGEVAHIYTYPATPEPKEVAADPAPDTIVAENQRRENLKVALREWKVPFKEAARTETLQKLYDEARQKRQEALEAAPEVAPAVEVPLPVAPETPAAPELPVTKEDAKNALIKLSGSGPDKKTVALDILHKYAEKLSDVAEKDYAAIVAECKKAEEA